MSTTIKVSNQTTPRVQTTYLNPQTFTVRGAADVAVSNPSDGQILTWSASLNKFIVSNAGNSAVAFALANQALIIAEASANIAANAGNVFATTYLTSGLTINNVTSLTTYGNATVLLTANAGSTTQPGALQLNDTLFSVSTTQAATANVASVLNTQSTAINTVAQGAFSKANSANILAQAAYNVANIANSFSATITAAFLEANGANGMAVGAYSTANAINIFATSGYGIANNALNLAISAFAQANVDATNITILNGIELSQNANIAAAFTEANNFQSIINSAFLLANSTTNLVTGAYSGANSAGNLALSAFAEANGFQSIINSAFLLANSTTNLATSAYGRANAAIQNQTTFISSNGITTNSATSLTITGNNTVLLSANLGNTTQAGIIQLNDTLTSTSTSLGTTANIANTIWTNHQAAYSLINSTTNLVTSAFNLANSDSNLINSAYNLANSTTNLTASVFAEANGFQSIINSSFTLANSTTNLVTSAYNRANATIQNQLTFISSNGITVNTGTTLTVIGNNTVLISANISNTTQSGLVQLNDTFTSLSTSQAATANVANTIWTTAVAAFNKANAGGGSISQTFITANGITVNTGTSLTVTGNNIISLSANIGNTTQPGIVQLNDTVTSTSVTQAATANAINTVWATANAAFIKANTGGGGGSVTTITYISDPAHPGLTVNTGVNIAITGNNTLILGANTATTSGVGVVQLNDTTLSNSTSLAATANSVNTVWAYAQSAFNLANSDTNLITSVYNLANSTTNLVTSAFSEANNFQSIINSAFILANSTTNLVTGAYTGANSAGNLSLSAFAEANGFQSIINSVFLLANSTTNLVQSAYTRANTLDGIASLTVAATGGVAVGGGSTSTLTANGTFTITANTATTGAVGVVQLNDTTMSTSTTLAATANSVNTTWAYAQSAFNLANSDTNLITSSYNLANSTTNLVTSAFAEANGFQSIINSAFTTANSAGNLATSAYGRANAITQNQTTFLSSNGITTNTATSLTISGNNTVLLSANIGNTTQSGIVQLNDSVTSTSTTLAATANAVNTVWATANAAFIKANTAIAIQNQDTIITSNGITVNSGTSLTVTGNATFLLSANIGNTTQQGIVQLSNSITSINITGATSNAVWSLYQQANTNTFTRNSIAWYFDTSGNLQQAANNVVRNNTNPNTLLSNGVLIEAQANNNVFNPSALGGSNIALPTSWSTAAQNGLTATIMGSGVENNIPYMDINWSGIPNANSSFARLTFLIANNQVLPLQQWTGSVFIRLIGGSTSNISSTFLEIDYANLANGFIGNATSANIWPIINGANTLSAGRISVTGTTVANTVYLSGFNIDNSYTVNNAINLTLRVGGPQVELGNVPTSLILSSNSKTTFTTRAADITNNSGYISFVVGGLDIGQGLTYATNIANNILAQTNKLVSNSSSILNILTYGADPLGIQDSRNAFINIINDSNAKYNTNVQAIIYVPAGNYFISNTLPIFYKTGVIKGDGANKTFINISPNYSGDVFSWTESWIASGVSNTGPTITGISITGARANTVNPPQQNALMFYDRNDFIRIDDVNVQYIMGRALGLGIQKNVSSSYIRESRITNFRATNCGNGTISVPIIELSSNSIAGADASNEVRFDKIDIYAPFGPAFVIRNMGTASAIRDITVDTLRIEGVRPFSTGINDNAVGDLIQIGDYTALGNVNTLSFTNIELLDGYNGYNNLNVIGGIGVGKQSYFINFQGNMLGGLPQGNSITIDNVRSSTFKLDALASNSSNISIITTSNTGGGIIFDGQCILPGTAINSSLANPSLIYSPVYRQGNLWSTAANATILTQNGTLVLNNIDIGSGLIQAQTNANSALNLATSAYGRANVSPSLGSITVTATGGIAVGAGSTSTLVANGTFALTANTATTAVVGVTQLNDTFTSTLTTQAATTNVANTIWTNHQAAYTAINSATNLVTSVYNLANSTTNLVASAFVEANGFQSIINSSFLLTNSTTNLVSSAYARANASAGYEVQNFTATNGLAVNTGSFITTQGNNTVAFTANNATITTVGVVQLNDTITSTSTTQAATANSVNTAWATANAAYIKANLNYNFGNAIIAANLTVTGGTSLIINSNTILVVSANLGNTTQLGVVQLNDTTMSTSSALAATANSVNTVWSYAQSSFILANSTTNLVTSVFAEANGFQSIINSAFSIANSASNLASSAYGRANTLDSIASLTITATGGIAVGGSSTSTLTANGSFALTANNGSTTTIGVVQLNDTTMSTSTSLAATANSVNTVWAYAQSAFNLANSDANLVTNAYLLANNIGNLVTTAYAVANNASNTAGFAFNTANAAVIRGGDTMLGTLTVPNFTSNIGINTNIIIANSFITASGNVTGQNLVTTGSVNSAILMISPLAGNGNISLTMANSGQILTVNTANLTTINVPNNTLSVGFRCIVTQLGTGNTKFNANASVTFHSTAGSNNQINGQYNSMSIFCYQANTFIIDGAIN